MWALHPGQIEPLNTAFTPDQGEFDRATAMLEAYAHATAVEGRGAVRFGSEMIDEASRKQAVQCAARGRAAGLHPMRTWADLKRDWEK
jgi:citrate lyase subunit beta/citryl-CoA lyase